MTSLHWHTGLQNRQCYVLCMLCKTSKCRWGLSVGVGVGSVTIINVQNYICHGCLCQRCTQMGSDWQPEVVLSRQVPSMQVWLNTISNWGGLLLAVPTGSGPCSAGTPTLVGAQCTGAQWTKLLGGQICLCTLNGFNLGIHVGRHLTYLVGDLAQRTKGWVD